MLAKIVAWGNSQGVRLPKHILDDVKISKGSIVEIKSKAGVIEIREVKNELTLDKIFEGYTGPKSKEFDWGSKKGHEAW